jgi:hypothetical protein
MRKAIDVKRILFTVPTDVAAWLEGRARYHGSTLSAEAVRSMRERMEREGAAAGKDRAGAGGE